MALVLGPGADGAQWSEHSWPELVELGLPRQLRALADELAHRNRRPVRVFAVSPAPDGTIDLALPLLCDDGIVLEDALLGDRKSLGRVIAHGLALMLHPRWSEFRAEDRSDMERLASAVAPRLLAHPPYEPVRIATLLAEAGWRPEGADVPSAHAGTVRSHLRLVPSNEA